VDSTIPGGDRMPFSGTSMASPNVANLAAKLLALNPKLSVADVIRLIKENTEKHEKEGFALIHPKKTVERVQHARAN
jgi:subtilisin family serine protease